MKVKELISALEQLSVSDPEVMIVTSNPDFYFNANVDAIGYDGNVIKLIGNVVSIKAIPKSSYQY